MRPAKFAVQARDAFECAVQGRRLLVPVDAVARIIQYDVVSLPLSPRPVSGLGVYDADLVMSLSLFDDAPVRVRRSVTGALFTFARPRFRFALEIGRVLSTVRIGNLGAPLAPWIVEAETSDGRTLPSLLVDTMFTELGVGASA